MNTLIFDGFPFYTAMADADKELLRKSVAVSKLDRGRIVTGDNSRCLGVMMVLSGRLRLFRLSEKGREVTLYRIGASEVCLLSGICALGNVQYHFSIEAERGSVVATMPPETFKQLLYNSAPFMSYVFGELAKRLIISIDTIEMLLFSSIEQRILEYLHSVSNVGGVVKTTHEKMATELGTSREVITRQLQKMADKGQVKLGRGRITLNKHLFLGNKVTD